MSWSSTGLWTQIVVISQCLCTCRCRLIQALQWTPVRRWYASQQGGALRMMSRSLSMTFLRIHVGSLPETGEAVCFLHTWSLTSVSSDLLLYQYFLLTGCNYDHIPIGCVLTNGKRHERHAMWFMKLNSWSFGLNATTNITKQWPSAWLFLSS